MLSNTCKATDQCIGGYARVVTKIKELLNERKNPLYLNAGDNFQGTLWYNVHRWNVTSYLLNLLPADVMVRIHTMTNTSLAINLINLHSSFTDYWKSRV